MCGINGFFNYSARRIDGCENLIHRMNEQLVHRGPDDNGEWCNNRKSIYLGHRRLSILDLSPRGHQPMHGQQDTTLVFNGEIYNFRELKKQFDAASFLSDSDTEVMLKLFDKKGISFVEDLNGMFAFGLWNERNQKLILARDRIGIKPLYYSVHEGIFSFSSEIRSLLELPWIQPEMDDQALYHYLTFNRVSHPDTMFRNIKKFNPGHIMTVSKHGIENYEPFWEVEYTDYSKIPDQDLQAMVLETLRTSVQRRMVSDVPVGAFLSGGVDSSAIVGLMNEFTDNPVKTYSIGFENAPDYDELEYASAISRKFGTEHYEKIVSRDDIVNFLPKIIDIFDEPLADATSIPIYFISELAKQNGSIVVLTGDGADEEFFGYSGWMPYIKWHPVYQSLRAMPVGIRKLIAGITGILGENTTAYEMVSRAANNQEFFWGGAGAFKESAKHSILSKTYQVATASVDVHHKIERLRGYYNDLRKQHGRDDLVDWISFVGVKDIIPNYYLYRADRLGMSQSIELRVPFLDHDVVNMALSIPGHRKLINKEPKGILKKSLEGLLDNETLYRKKVGFCVPLDLWLKDIIAGNVEDQLSDFCSNTELFNMQGIRKLIKRCRNNEPNSIHGLWNLYFLINWHKRWIN